jgi:mono/diheme cytochrome c family protein
MSQNTKEQVYGVVAEYDTVDEVMAAARKVRDAGYTKWDVHTPFPVHGLDGAMGIRPTILPWLVLGAGLTGLFGATLMQWWMNAVDYRFAISGKPMWSLAANIPVIFESTVLLSALTAVFGTLALNKLPQLYHPLQRLDRFSRVTDDKFFVVIEAADPNFKEGRTTELLESTGSGAIEVCTDTVGGLGIPKGIKIALAFLLVFSWFPLALAYRARTEASELPRIHLVADMDHQPKVKAQNKWTQKQVANTIGFGELRTDRHLHEGKMGPGETDWATTWPIAINEKTMQRGHERYDIYCSVCHGLTGEGDGMVAQRAALLNEKGDAAWTAPANFGEDKYLTMPIGEIYNTIKNGKNTMKGYGRQIPVEDRWAIALYVRALQAQRGQ